MNPERRGLGEADFEFTGEWWPLDPIWRYCEMQTWEDHYVFLSHRYDYARVLVYRVPAGTWFDWDFDRRTEEVLAFVRKSECPVDRPEARAAALDQSWAKTYPALWEHLTLGAYENGDRRVLSTLSWFLGLEGLTICLQDRDNKRSLFASGTSWVVALDVLEELARRGEQAPWRADKRDTGGSARLKGR
jgi:hypothetical protein